MPKEFSHSFCLYAFKRYTVTFENDFSNGGSGKTHLPGNDTLIGELPDVGNVAFLGKAI